MKALHFTFEDKAHLPNVSVGEPVWRVWRKMKSLNCKYMAVVNGRALVGIVKERDIRMVSQIQGGESADVTEVMIPNPVTFKMKSTVEEVMAAMLNKHLEHVVIIDDEYSALKVITVHQIIKYILTLPNRESWGEIERMLEKTA